MRNERILELKEEIAYFNPPIEKTNPYNSNRTVGM